ncbi:hypothetical protein PVAND_005671 [Polypedilum vanderplanki]|uniref:Uncharacterized protein n=1 Tax=Polypedilum vanderplanki TaxID=319348 RepID=A0A9J6C1Q9_POLVA|nr:hypothetical protein PVAND_005671 [Polypedilum vanderplanki]
MGLNRFISLSRNSVLPDFKQVSSKPNKSSSNSVKIEHQTEKSAKKEEIEKIDKTNLKNGKSATTTKKSMLWNLRITNKSKIGSKKGKFQSSINYLD